MRAPQEGDGPQGPGRRLTLELPDLTYRHYLFPGAAGYPESRWWGPAGCSGEAEDLGMTCPLPTHGALRALRHPDPAQAKEFNMPKTG